jgi:predicted ATPase/DNA-binding SARP family transcriptional activator
VLGPLEIVEGGAVLAPGAGRQVTLLCCLLLHRGTVVSRDRLIDALWGARPPATAANALQVQVHSLRRLLGPDRIATEGTGYRLLVAPEETDAGRFEALLERGRDELERGEAGAAGEHLREAIDLWRGAAYQDVLYEEFAATEIARLEELRLDATELRIEADLALGRHQALVSELEGLVVRHSGRERLTRQLMLALYRCGRQGEALEAYRSAARTLRDELGLEPGPALRELERAILRQDPALSIEPPELRARRRLPAPGTTLVGRKAELGEVDDLLRRAETRLVTLTGPGGIGKTRIAIQAAHDLVDAFHDGVFFVDLANLVDPALVPPAIARVLSLEEPSGADLLDALREHLATRRCLLLLDNFEVVDDAAPVVSELLAGAAGLAVLVTSRTALRLTGEHEVRVQPLALADAVQLFAARARAVAPAFRRPAEESDEVAEICRRLDCLPLAIELAAARTREYAPAELLAQVPGTLDLATGGGRDLPDRQRTLRATIAWSNRLLDPAQAAAFASLGVFAGGFTFAAADAVCGATRPTVASLVARSLVHERPGHDGEPRCFMLEAVREHALELLAEGGDADDIRRRHATYFATLAAEADSEPLANHPQSAWPRLDVEHDNLRAAILWSHAHDALDLELRLVGSLAYFWSVRGYLLEGRRRIEAALEHAAGADPLLRARALAGGARLAHSLGDYEQMASLSEESLALCRSLADHGGTVLALNGLASALRNLGDLDRSIEIQEEAAALARETGDDRSLAAALNNLGYSLLSKNEIPRARVYCVEGLEVCRRIGHRTGVSILLGNLGLADVLEGEHDRALATFREILLHDREIGYTEGLVYGLAGFAASLAAGGRAEDAATILGAAQAGADRTGLELEALERSVEEGTIAALRERLGEELFAETRGAGAHLSLDDAIEHALRLSVRGSRHAPPPARPPLTPRRA